MKHIEGSFAGPRGLNIHYQGWVPDQGPKATILLVHGLAEHCGRYHNIIGHMVPRGYAVYGLDHIGHGKSGGQRVYIERFDDFIEPLKQYFSMVQTWQPGKPIFILGHSLGGLITVTYLMENQAGLAGAVISAPAIKIPAETSPVTVAIARLMSLLAPKFAVTALDVNGVSRDPAVIQAYINDPLNFTGKVTARLMAETLETMVRVNKGFGKISLPFLTVQGGDDKLVDPGGAQLLFDKAASKDKTIKIYPGLYHEIFNEPERETVLRDVEQWLAAHL